MMRLKNGMIRYDCEGILWYLWSFGNITFITMTRYAMLVRPLRMMSLALILCEHSSWVRKETKELRWWLWWWWKWCRWWAEEDDYDNDDNEDDDDHDKDNDDNDHNEEKDNHEKFEDVVKSKIILEIRKFCIFPIYWKIPLNSYKIIKLWCTNECMSNNGCSTLLKCLAAAFIVYTFVHTLLLSFQKIVNIDWDSTKISRLFYLILVTVTWYNAYSYLFLLLPSLLLSLSPAVWPLYTMHIHTSFSSSHSSSSLYLLQSGHFIQCIFIPLPPPPLPPPLFISCSLATLYNVYSYLFLLLPFLFPSLSPAVWPLYTMYIHTSFSSSPPSSSLYLLQSGLSHVPGPEPHPGWDLKTRGLVPGKLTQVSAVGYMRISTCRPCHVWWWCLVMFAYRFYT